jgi:hypothetical protein
MYFFIVQIHVDRRLYIFRLCVELQVVFFFFFLMIKDCVTNFYLNKFYFKTLNLVNLEFV